MAFTSIIFQHPKTGVMKVAPVGFSWSTLFFGFFYALARGDRKWGFIQLALFILVLPLSNLAFSFIYNKLYIKDLISSGYKAYSVANGELQRAAEQLGLEIPALHAV